MPTNTQLVASLTPQTVPPDLVCVPGDMNLLLPLIAQFLAVNATTAEVDQNSTNSIAQQALETANIALTTAQAALAAIPATRSSGSPQLIAAGDSVLPISFGVPMPNINYEVRGTWYGQNVAVANTQIYAFRVIDGTQTVNGCSLRLDNVPASTKFAWVAQQLP